MRQILIIVGLFIAFFAGGFWGMPLAIKQWQRWFPEQMVVVGDYTEHYAFAKTDIVLYGTQTCPYCKQAREYLGGKQIRFADLSVDQSLDARAQYQKLGVEGVPVLLIGRKLIRGFSPLAIDEALASRAVR